MKPRLEIIFPLKSQWAFWTGKPYQPAQGEFLLNHARSGILLALQALALPAGSGVGVMAFNCHTVFNAVHQAGYQPVFLDVTDALVLNKDDLARKRGTIQALVVTHLFGILNDVDSIRKNYPDLPVIEDCAHAYGLEQVSGDFAVFSIGQGKLPSLGDGGILFVKNRKYGETIARLYSDLLAYSWQGTLKQSLVMWIKSMSYIPFVYSSVTRFIKSRRKPFSGVENVVPRKMSKGIRALYSKTLNTIPEAIVRRKKKWSEVSAFLCGLPGVNRVLGASINGFMAIAECENVGLVKMRMQQQGIETETHFGHCIDWAKAFGYEEGDCPRTEFLVNHLLMVPTY